MANVTTARAKAVVNEFIDKYEAGYGDDTLSPIVQKALDEQTAEAVKLLRALHADIDAMRSKADRMEFAGFAGRYEEDDTLTIDWPNLAILADQVAAFLKEVGNG